jgi:hypothetical protein
MSARPRLLVNLHSENSQAPTSAVLLDLLLQTSDQTVTFGWLMGSLGDRSFGIVLLLLGLLASLPGASTIAGLIIVISACQMILARHEPALPGFLARRKFRKDRLAWVLNRAVPRLRHLEKYIRPRWQGPFEITKRVVGGAILLMGGLLFAPIPLSNVPPAIAIVLIAFAYLEKDGVLLIISLVVAFVLLLVAGEIIWQAMGATGWVGGFLVTDILRCRSYFRFPAV